MKAVFFHLCFLLSAFSFAQSISGYQPLDKSHPVIFRGSHIIFKGDTVVLGPRAFFIDGQLSDAEASKYPYVFNSVNKAAKQLTNGTETSPMVLYLAPYVYWIDDPDDPAVRIPKEGATPYGLEIACEWLKFYGLTDKAENVVLASNRGQTIGAQGNFTMFKFTGQGTGSENLTFGNYCNVDLVYPLKPSLNRAKRASAIVQAQLIHCNGDKILARNTRFISRLNLCPFVGGKRVLFDRCHFECTDDALCGMGVYLNSTLDFYSSKPFYRTTGTGAVFLNCDVRSFSGDKQYFTKAGGQVSVLDCRFTTPAINYWGWQDVVPAETRNYQSNVSLNQKGLFIGKAEPASTVELQGKRLADAYRFVHNGKVVYNTYNLLSGDDDWDPMGIKPILLTEEKEAKKTYTKIPVQLILSPTRVSIETNKDSLKVTAKTMRFGNYPSVPAPLKWDVAPADKSFVRLIPSDDGKACTVVPTNTTDNTRQIIVRAVTASGLEAASVITVAPSILDAPAFSKLPTIALPANGKVRADYALNAKYLDQSAVTWYRCTDSKGSNPIEVAVSRFDVPLLDYQLSAGDIGYFLMISVVPKHTRSSPGGELRFVMKQRIAASDVKAPQNVLITDFKNASLRNQPKPIPGFWIWDHIDATESDTRNNADKSKDAWYYGEGAEGAAGYQGLLQGRHARMSYTPPGTPSGNMKLQLIVAPFKSAGQGFSVAHLYQDVLIGWDAKNRTGYALRFIRTTKTGNAVDCMLMRYENGKPEPLTKPMTTTVFRTLCTITMEIKGNRLAARVTTTAADTNRSAEGISNDVVLEAAITPTGAASFGIEYNGGSPTLIKELRAEWK